MRAHSQNTDLTLWQGPWKTMLIHYDDGSWKLKTEQQPTLSEAEMPEPIQ